MQVYSPSIELMCCCGGCEGGGADGEGELHTYIYISSTRMCNISSCVRLYPQHSYGNNNSVSLPHVHGAFLKAPDV